MSSNKNTKINLKNRNSKKIKTTVTKRKICAWNHWKLQRKTLIIQFFCLRIVTMRIAPLWQREALTFFSNFKAKRWKTLIFFFYIKKALFHIKRSVSIIGFGFILFGKSRKTYFLSSSFHFFVNGGRIGWIKIFFNSSANAWLFLEKILGPRRFTFIGLFQGWVG